MHKKKEWWDQAFNRIINHNLTQITGITIIIIIPAVLPQPSNYTSNSNNKNRKILAETINTNNSTTSPWMKCLLLCWITRVQQPPQEWMIRIFCNALNNRRVMKILNKYPDSMKFQFGKVYLRLTIMLKMTIMKVDLLLLHMSSSQCLSLLIIRLACFKVVRFALVKESLRDCVSRWLLMA